MSDGKKRVGGFPVRYFQTNDCRFIEAWLIKTGPGYNSYRWRMCYAKTNRGFAFGIIGTSVAVNNSLTDAAKAFALTEIDKLPEFTEEYFKAYQDINAGQQVIVVKNDNDNNEEQDNEEKSE